MVVSENDYPIEGAHIRGGIDWFYFDVQTDSTGSATLPEYAENETATIFATNFFPRTVELLKSGIYTLAHTEKNLQIIGEIQGKAIKFGADTIISITYQGDYHVYVYNDNNVTEIASAVLPPCVRRFKLAGDTLWYSAFNDGIYVYSIANCLNPQQICHLGISGYGGPFAVMDSLVAVCEQSAPGQMRIFTFSYDGQVNELSSIGDFCVNDMIFISHYLVLVGKNGQLGMPIVFDLQDPTNPRLVYNGIESCQSGIIFDTMLIMVPNYGHATGYVDYEVMDLHNPSNPQMMTSFTADGWISDVVDEITVIGRYYFDLTGSIAVFQGAITGSLRTKAICSDGELIDGYGGGRPPYFIIGNQLCKIE